MRYSDERLTSIERKLDDLLARVERLERRSPPERPQPRAREEAPPPDLLAPSAPKHPADLPAERAPAPAAAVGRPSLPAFDLEALLGGRLLAWVGSVAILLGVGFFLATAIRRGWIDEATRVALAYTGSAALLVVGLYLYERRGRTQAALAAVATAIAALYASTTAATQLYELVSAALGLVVAGLIGATATAIAVRWSSPIVGGIGIVGAIVSPVLVNAGTSGFALAFMAIALVSAAGVVLWQRWSWLAVAAFVTSAPQLLAWVADDYADRLVLTLAVVALFWAVYVVAAIGYELRVPTERLRLESASLLLADSLLVAGTGWYVLDDTGHDSAATAWVIGTSIAHLALGSLTWRRVSREISLLTLAVAIGLSAIGVALALDGPALVAAWSVEAVVLAWLGRRLGRERAYVATGGFLGLATVHVLSIDAPPEALTRAPDATAIVAVVLVAAAAAACTRLYAGRWSEGRDALELLAVAALAYLPPIAFEGVPVALAWSAEAVALTLLARTTFTAVAADTAPGFLALAAAHALAVEAPPIALRDGVDDLASAVLALAGAGAATIAVRALRDWQRGVALALEIAAGAALVYLPSVVIVDLTAGADEPGQTPQVLLSAFWTLTGLGAFVYGLVRRDRRVEYAGLALLGVAVIKVFLYDLASLDEIYRVLSFIALGLLLLAAAFAYERVRRTVKAER